MAAIIIAITKPALKASSIKPQPDNDVANNKHTKGKVEVFIGKLVYGHVDARLIPILALQASCI